MEGLNPREGTRPAHREILLGVRDRRILSGRRRPADDELELSVAACCWVGGQRRRLGHRRAGREASPDRCRRSTGTRWPPRRRRRIGDGRGVTLLGIRSARCSRRISAQSSAFNTHFLLMLITIGMAAAIIGFRHGSRNEFEIEADIVEEGRCATPHVH